MPTTLTIGMATHTDFDGLYFSVNALRMYHGDVLNRCDIVVVDNAPNSECGKRAKGLFAHVQSGLRKSALPQPRQVRLLELEDIQGTAAPRQRIFDAAETDAVLVMDSHVLLWPGALARLLKWYDDHPDCLDLISGPLTFDSLDGSLTQFNDIWRNGMWGIWGHDARGDCDDNEAFEIPAQGLGLFTCRRDAWLGFNPLFREFGGEEFYIHSKFRQAGRKCLCLPFLRWVHRFGNPVGGRKSPLSLSGKIRNYMIGHLELGLPIERLRRHFVDGFNEDSEKCESVDQRISASQFADLLAITKWEMKEAGQLT